MACGRRCAVAGPTVQRTGSRSFPIASASSVSRAVVVVRLAKRCSDTGIPGNYGSRRWACLNTLAYNIVQSVLSPRPSTLIFGHNFFQT